MAKTEDGVLEQDVMRRHRQKPFRVKFLLIGAGIGLMLTFVLSAVLGPANAETKGSTTERAFTEEQSTRADSLAALRLCGRLQGTEGITDEDRALLAEHEKLLVEIVDTNRNSRQIGKARGEALGSLATLTELQRHRSSLSTNTEKDSPASFETPSPIAEQHIATVENAKGALKLWGAVSQWKGLSPAEQSDVKQMFTALTELCDTNVNSQRTGQRLGKALLYRARLAELYMRKNALESKSSTKQRGA